MNKGLFPLLLIVLMSCGERENDSKETLIEKELRTSHAMFNEPEMVESEGSFENLDDGYVGVGWDLLVVDSTVKIGGSLISYFSKKTMDLEGKEVLLEGYAISDGKSVVELSKVEFSRILDFTMHNPDIVRVELTEGHDYVGRDLVKIKGILKLSNAIDEFPNYTIINAEVVE